MSDHAESKRADAPSQQLSDASEELGDRPKRLSEQLKFPSGSRSASRKALLDQAKKFLEEGEVKAAPLERRIAFLEGKGLHTGEIQDLLGVSRAPSVTEASSTSSSSSTSPQTSPDISMQADTLQNPRRLSSIPPIIAYPEFLIKPTRPPPLVTKTRLLTALYLFSGLSLILHGTKNYLVAPMLSALLEARLSFASTAKANLQKLVERLENSVSSIPPYISKLRKDMSVGPGEEADSDVGDPTELFHRDVGVQTDLHESLPTTLTSAPDSPEERQRVKLESITASLSSLVDDSTSEDQELAELNTTLTILRDYCDSLVYVPPSSWEYHGASGNGKGREKQEDEVDRLKKEIRGIKGIFLGARRFPPVNGGAS